MERKLERVSKLSLASFTVARTASTCDSGVEEERRAEKASVRQLRWCCPSVMRAVTFFSWGWAIQWDVVIA